MLTLRVKQDHSQHPPQAFQLSLFVPCQAIMETQLVMHLAQKEGEKYKEPSTRYRKYVLNQDSKFIHELILRFHTAYF